MFKYYFIWIVMTGALVFSFKTFADESVQLELDGVIPANTQAADTVPADQHDEILNKLVDEAADQADKKFKEEMTKFSEKELPKSATTETEIKIASSQDLAFKKVKDTIEENINISKPVRLADQDIAIGEAQKTIADNASFSAPVKLASQDLEIKKVKEALEAKNLKEKDIENQKRKLEEMDKKIEAYKNDKTILDSKDLQAALLKKQKEIKAMDERIEAYKKDKTILDSKDLQAAMLKKRREVIEEMDAKIESYKNDDTILDSRDLKAIHLKKERELKDLDKKIEDYKDDKSIEDGKDLKKQAEKNEKDCVNCDIDRRIGSLSIQIENMKRMLAGKDKDEDAKDKQKQDEPYMASLEKYMSMFTTTMTKMLESQQAISQSIAALAANMQNSSQMNNGIFQGILLGSILNGGYRPQDSGAFNPYSQQYVRAEDRVMDKYLGSSYAFQSRQNYGVPAFVFNNISNRS